MSKQENSIGDIEIRGKLGIEDIVRRQIDRCNFSSPYPDEFASNVNALYDILPTHKREELEDRVLEYSYIKKYVEYGTYWCGVPLTSSKRIVTRAETDFHKFYQMILTALEESRLTYQSEPKLYEEKRITKEKKSETPLLPDPEDSEVKEDK